VPLFTLLPRRLLFSETQGVLELQASLPRPPECRDQGELHPCRNAFATVGFYSRGVVEG
jgi:hypothetical protein